MEPVCNIESSPDGKIPVDFARSSNLVNPILWISSHAIYSTLSWVYDYLFFGGVLYFLGPIKGGLVLCATTAVVDYYTLKFYQVVIKDLLGIEYIRSTQSYQGRNPLKRSLGFILNHAPTWLQIVALTPKSNAFLTTALLRDGDSSFSHMSARDWRIFWGSFVCSQIYWITLVWLGVEGLEGLFGLLVKG